MEFILPTLAACLLVIALSQINASKRWLALLAWLVAIMLAFLLALNRLPGLSRISLYQDVYLSPDSPLFSLSINTGKAVVAVVLCIAFSTWLKPAYKIIPATMLVRLVLLFVLTPVVILGLGYALQLVTWQPKWPAVLLPFLLANLLITCVAEEYFFRGLIQAQLQRLFFGEAALISILITAVLFALVHAPAGFSYALLAGISAIFHGVIFQLTGRIELCVLNHWFLNMVHFMWFSYPMAVISTP
ncbi:MAG: CPBP family intramembrane metalloprotease [Pseudomonadales bacterium]|nr:CPBP family intramembrane metalloprotease [Pseudomonadales bacterium]